MILPNNSKPEDRIILANICQEVYISGEQNSHQYWMKETSLEANVKYSLVCP